MAAMREMRDSGILKMGDLPAMERANLVLAFTGWMNGGDVSTGTVQNLVDLLQAQPVAEIDPEPFSIYCAPGPMEVAAMYRPHVEIEEGLVKKIDLPSNTFYCCAPANLVLFLGQEPHLRWPTFGQCVFEVARRAHVRRIVFVGSFGGPVPHTRLPRLYISCSDARLLPEMEQYGVRRTGYQGPGAFTTYLMTQARAADLEMVSLVVEVPGYLQGTNPASIEAVTWRLLKLLGLHVDLTSLRNASTAWELHVSQLVEQNDELAATIRKLEEAYDNERLSVDLEQT
jgi:proteasome assembly chaperone (PAC2) family protein